MNGEKIAKNVCHAVVIGVMSYFSTHPDSTYLWLAPAFAWLGQCLNPPSITPGE